MNELAIEVVSLRKAYGKIQALAGVSLQVPKGRLFGVIGPNGAGKTTLFSVLCGYIRADSGQVRLHGREIGFGRPLPVHLSTFPQDSLMLEGLSVKQHLIYYAKLSGIPADQAESEASRVLHLVKLPEAWERSPKRLSHGQRKRVGLAQAFIGRPDVIILDEPTAGLDPESARQVRSAIREAATDRTVLVSSHDLDQVQELCTDVAILDKGKVARIDRMSEITHVGGKVAFKITEKPSDMFIQSVADLAYVRTAVWDNADARLRIECDPTQMSAEEASGQLVQFLVSNGVRFTDVQVGQRLADVVRDETGN